MKFFHTTNIMMHFAITELSEMGFLKANFFLNDQQRQILYIPPQQTKGKILFLNERKKITKIKLNNNCCLISTLNEVVFWGKKERNFNFTTIIFTFQSVQLWTELE